MRKIDENELKTMYREIEIIRGKLLSLYFRMEEGDYDNSDEKLARRYETAKDVVSSSSDDLLLALDVLRAR